jgi:hypothetical protein
MKPLKGCNAFGGFSFVGGITKGTKGVKHMKGFHAFRLFRPFVVLELTTHYYASGQPIATRMDSTQRPFGFWKPEGSVLADQGQRLC